MSSPPPAWARPPPGGGPRTADVLCADDAGLTFAGLGLPEWLASSLEAAGFRRPTPVQRAAAPLARLGADLVVQAKAGTGKTAVFAIAAAERCDAADPSLQALVVAPTREVALQAAEVVAAVAGGAGAGARAPLVVGCFVGGLPTAEDERLLRRPLHVAVGTPGRLLALLRRGSLVLKNVRLLVLDEADALLGGAPLAPDVAELLAAAPPAGARQALALSATFSAGALAAARALMRAPREVRLCAASLELLGVRQYYKDVDLGGGGSGGSSGPGGDGLRPRLAALLAVLRGAPFHQALVFCGARADADAAAAALAAAGFPAAALSAAHAQLQRLDVLNGARAFRLRVVAATDVAARGVDLEGVDLVVSLAPAPDAATHMHRAGRAGRYGGAGAAVTFVAGAAEAAVLAGHLAEAGAAPAAPLPAPGGGALSGWAAPVGAGAEAAEHVVVRSLGDGEAGSGRAAGGSGGQVLAATPARGGALDARTASLWPDELGRELPTSAVWPPRLTHPDAALPPPPLPPPPPLSPPPPPPPLPSAAVLGKARAPASASGGASPSLSYEVVSPPGGRSERSAPSSAPAAGGHFELLLESARLDLGAAAAEPHAAARSAALLAAAFAPVRAADEGEAAPAPAVPAEAPLGPRRGGPLQSAQAAAARRAERREAAAAAEGEADPDGLAAAAAQLEALAFNSDGDEELEGDAAQQGHEGAEAAGEDEWRRYWLAHYAAHGRYPGAEAYAGGAAPSPPPPPAPPPPPPALSPAGGAPPSPAPSPGAWRGAEYGGAGGGLVAVPAALVERYQQLEWGEWRRAHAEWSAEFEAWRARYGSASPPPPGEPARRRQSLG